MRLTVVIFYAVFLFAAAQQSGAVDRLPPNTEKNVSEANQLANNLLLQGIDAEKRGDSVAAEDAYLRSLQLFKESGPERTQLPSLHRLAVLKAKQNKFDESERYFKTAIPYGQSNIALISDYAQLQFDRRRFRESEILLKHCLLIDMENTRVLHKLGYAVAFQQDRQTEGLRYLKLALGEVQALRELAKIDRVLGLEEQAIFAEQRADLLERQQKNSGAASVASKDVESNKELYEQIRRELIREHSIQLAAEFEKAGLNYLIAKDEQEQRKNELAATNPQPEVGVSEIAVAGAKPDELRKINSNVAPLPKDNTSAWDIPSGPQPAVVSNLPKQAEPTVQSLKSLPTANFGPVPTNAPTDAKNAKQKLRISNEESAVPLPPVESRLVDQRHKEPRHVKPQQTAEDKVARLESAATPQYPQYAQIGSKPLATTPPLAQIPSNGQRPISETEKLLHVQSKPGAASENSIAPRPTSTNLVQPFDLATMGAQRQKTVVSEAPTPENMNEIRVRQQPMLAPSPETSNENRLQSQELRSPEGSKDRKPVVQSRNSAAPTPDTLSGGYLTPSGNPPTVNPLSVHSPERKEQAAPTAVKAWKEIDVEPYIYVENVRPAPQTASKEQSIDKSNPLVAQTDPWDSPRPASEMGSDIRANKLRENDNTSTPGSLRTGDLTSKITSKEVPKMESKSTSKPGDDFTQKIIPGLIAEEKPKQKKETTSTSPQTISVKIADTKKETTTTPQTVAAKAAETKKETAATPQTVAVKVAETKKETTTTPQTVAVKVAETKKETTSTPSDRLSESQAEAKQNFRTDFTVENKRVETTSIAAAKTPVEAELTSKDEPRQKDKSKEIIRFVQVPVPTPLPQEPAPPQEPKEIVRFVQVPVPTPIVQEPARQPEQVRQLEPIRQPEPREIVRLVPVPVPMPINQEPVVEQTREPVTEFVEQKIADRRTESDSTVALRPAPQEQPRAKVRIINIDVPEPVDNKPGFARSGQFSK